MKPLQSKQHALNRKTALQRFLAKRPEEAVYGGESDYSGDWVEQENRHNEMLAEEVKEEIRKCDLFLAKNS